MRKFAKVIVLPTENISKEFEKMGPEPFDKNFNFKILPNYKNKKGKIKRAHGSKCNCGYW